MARLNKITKKWGNKSIFKDFSLEIPDGKITAVVGRSGVGKTTLLSIVAGLTDFEGEAFGFGDVSYVFQEPRLIPFLTVKENLLYALSGVMGEAEALSAIDGYIKAVGIDGLLNKRASLLSGGEKQRVSLIRAFSYPSKTILCDEPFSSLDLGLKRRIMDIYIDLLTYSGKTSVIVTHSVDEAVFLGDKIVFLGDGRFEEFSNPTPRAERKYGYEADPTLRARLLELLS